MNEETVKSYYAAGHTKIVAQSVWCRCYFCYETFPASAAEALSTDGAMSCPACWIDAVVGDASGLDVGDEKLKELHRHDWGDWL